MRVRRAALDDLDSVAALFDAYRVFYGNGSDLDGALAFLGERLRNGDSVIFLVEVDDEAAGFTQLYPSFTSTGMRRIWILNDLFVAPEHRRSGVGQALMEAAREFGIKSGAARLELATQKHNHTAKALYLAAGYRLDETFDRFELRL